MRKIHLMIIIVISTIAVQPMGGHAQTWLDFAHPSTPHIDITSPNVPISTPGLVQGNADVTVTRPTLVVLMEWSDMTHRPEHTVAFWRDLVFGQNRQPRPSAAKSLRRGAR